MDPVATLRRALEAADEGDLVEVARALDDYQQWRNKGGFDPSHETLKITGDELAAVMLKLLGSGGAEEEVQW